MKVDFENWSINDLVLAAHNNATELFAGDECWQNEINKGADFLQKFWENKGTVYGVTTGSRNIK